MDCVVGTTCDAIKHLQFFNVDADFSPSAAEWAGVAMGGTCTMTHLPSVRKKVSWFFELGLAGTRFCD